MTNAIEQSKREMYQAFANLKGRIEINYSIKDMLRGADEFEGVLEDYLELLRQDHEALHETARKRFEDIQSLEQANRELCGSLASVNNTIQICASHSLNTIRDLEERLANMTAERDHLRNRMQASEHAYSEQQSKLHPCMVEEKGLQDDWDAEFKCDSGKPRKCLHDDCKARKEAIATMARENGDRVSCATLDGKTAAILGAVVDARQIVSDWAVYGYKAKKQMKKLAYAINNNPELHSAMLEFEKPADSYGNWFISNGSDNCQHAYHNGKCLYCLKIGR